MDYNIPEWARPKKKTFFNLACPRCESENIPTYNKTHLDNNDSLICSDCSYSQLAWRFEDQYKIKQARNKKEVS